MNYSNRPFEVDLVYLWVNGADPEWQARRNALIGVAEESSAVNCDGRYADNDELKYSLRAAAMYAPWIRKIFIVTDNQVPQWLDTSNPRIRIVDHKEILPEKALPTFNSRVIEHNLYRIPDLSEHFLYANDDMFFNRPVGPADFFEKDGYPIVRLNRRPFRKLSLKLKEKLLGKPISNYNKAIQRAAELVESRFGIYFGSKTHHNIDAYCKSTYRHIREDLFKKEIEPTMVNHVRSENDVQRNIYTYVAIAEKKAHRSYVSRKTSFRLHIDNPKHFGKLDRVNPMLFCMNDSQYATPADRERVKKYLHRRFPHPSEFEISQELPEFNQTVANQLFR